MDREAWWAAVYGVAQSRTRLKRLSSSSSLPYGAFLLGKLFAELSYIFYTDSFIFKNPKYF